MASRKQRSLTQKIYLIESTNDLEYHVMGSTGNVYIVKLSNSPTCTCPDHTTRGRRCKHIYFILIRIMKVNNADRDIYSDDEIVLMLSNKAYNPIFCVNDELKEKYKKLTTSLKGNNENNNNIDLDDICPICLDDLDNGEEYDYCRRQCKKCVHVECFKMWCKKNKAQCLFCKSDWHNANSSNYINLA